MNKYKVQRTKDERQKAVAAWAALLCTLSFFLCPSRTRGDDLDRLPNWEARAYSLILPAESEIRWYRIPWLLELQEAVKVAKKEKRPLLIWTTGDDPLERC